MNIERSGTSVVNVTPFTANIKNLKAQKVPQAVRARPSDKEELEIRQRVKRQTRGDGMWGF
jgi:hypothetical protein